MCVCANRMFDVRCMLNPRNVDFFFFNFFFGWVYDQCVCVRMDVFECDQVLFVCDRCLYVRIVFIHNFWLGLGGMILISKDDDGICSSLPTFFLRPTCAQIIVNKESHQHY